MKPGRKFDALIAEKVDEVEWCLGGCDGENWGWGEPCPSEEMYYTKCDNCGKNAPGHMPFFSTSIAAAWQVVEKFKRNFEIWKNLDEQWYAQIGLVSKNSATAKTAPHAICLAALKVVGYKEEKKNDESRNKRV